MSHAEALNMLCAHNFSSLCPAFRFVCAVLRVHSDLCTVFGRQMAPVLNGVFAQKLVAEGLTSNEKQTRQVAKWAKKLVAKVGNHVVA